MNPEKLTLLQNAAGESAIGPNEQTLRDIQAVIASRFAISIEDLLSESRFQRYAYPRQVAMYFCRTLTQASLHTIGTAFHRDHGTVLYAFEAVTQTMQHPVAARSLQSLEIALRAKLNKGFRQSLEAAEELAQLA